LAVFVGLVGGGKAGCSSCLHGCVADVGVGIIIIINIVTNIVSYYYYNFRHLNRQFAERLKSVFLQTMQNPGSDGSTLPRKSSSELAEKISGLWVNAKLFEKGLRLFDGEMTDLTNGILSNYATELHGNL